MTSPLIILVGGIVGIPIFIIIAVILTIRRLVINAREKKKNSQTYTPPPPHQQGYTQQPNYQQPNYQQPPQHYQQPPQPYQQQYSQPQTGPARRSTPIPSHYATHMGEGPKKKRNVFLIAVLTIVGIAVLALGGIMFASYSHDHGQNLTTADFTLAYENPTDKAFTIILDDWDTIKVAPYTAAEDLDYTVRRDQQTFHWKMLDASGKTIADTTVDKDAITEWFNSNGWADKYNEGTILLNPSRSEFVTYAVWHEEDGSVYADTMTIGDSVFVIDAVVTTSAFIFDFRDPDYITALDGSTPYGSNEQSQYLVSARDFAVLYKNLSGNNTPLAKFRAYKNHLDVLVTLSRSALLGSSNSSYQDQQVVDGLDNLIPSSVDASTVPRDFVPAIDYVRANSDFFIDMDYDQYVIVDDSADTVLKNAYSSQSDVVPFPALHLLSFTVEENGIFDDEPLRKNNYEMEREEDGSGIY